MSSDPLAQQFFGEQHMKHFCAAFYFIKNEILNEAGRQIKNVIKRK